MAKSTLFEMALNPQGTGWRFALFLLTMLDHRLHSRFSLDEYQIWILTLHFQLLSILPVLNFLLCLHHVLLSA